MGLLFMNIPLCMLPTSIAGYRAHQNTGAVAILNVLLGWTGLGWVAALAWSFAKPASRPFPHDPKKSQIKARLFHDPRTTH